MQYKLLSVTNHTPQRDSSWEAYQIETLFVGKKFRNKSEDG
jgi:hypothetical protein